ncbi:MAG: serine protein kinase PrkA, partial [Planctomycetes bacterium]|nr:serine protein kinase PrkA [Planctomycetota bacterium]
MSEIRDIVQTIGRRSSERFAEARAISSFEQFLELLFARPASLTRSAPQYIVDMMDYYGSRVVATPSGPQRRFCVFDDVEGGGDEAVVGQERVQNDIYRCLREFIQKRKTDRMLLLHGPNGSSKTSLVHALMLGLERYSLTEEGMLLRFNWIFSEAVDRGERLGFDPALPEEDLESFAFLDPDRISAKIPCELSDNPIFLIPSMDRDEILQQAFEHAGDEQRRR